ncbi:asparagine synthetase B [Halieaceae bacterium IMCC14734]|uniref:asparagine synthase (glutamine-hydrolyzing) n=1 Tax=Candidatus Litorirhabdus singularis TaxID=2518993 RepID=A0ABT3TEN9_9GAMM|nr:asparagine synthase-related protein [Candidatus Litorirhabdus singularis]MCX2980783.1 asparagine synthetase B [Candidatus Litorirhabdus singularis]
MSAMFGIVRFDGGQVNPADMQLMAAAMDYRGPNGEGLWCDGRVGLGHLMLHTTAESLGETLPWQDPFSSLVITADARIDNRPELLAKLNISGSLASATADSQLILLAYRKWGEQCLEHLLGDFSFAIWDEQKKTLFCARDHMGVKPFYYYHSDSAVVFSSAVEGILALDWVPKTLNEPRITDYLLGSLEGIDKTSTFYRHIARHPPAHTLEVNYSGRLSRRQYWQLEDRGELYLATETEYNEAFLEQLNQAIRPRLRSAGDAGVALSGGIDSGAIVAIARQLMPTEYGGKLQTFSGASRDAANCSETRRLLDVIAQGGVEANTVFQDQMAEFEHELSPLLHHTCDPFDNRMSLYPTVCAAAKRAGVRVLLDGVDDVIMDTVEQDTAYMLRSGNWAAVWREHGAIARLSGGDSSRTSLLLDDFRSLLITPALRSLWRKLKTHPSVEQLIEGTILNRQFASDTALPERLETMRLNQPVKMLKSLRCANAAEISQPWLTVALERYERIAARHGVEPRHPYCDKRFVEFCLTLPAAQRDYQGWPKITLRRAMQGKLPEASLWQADGEHLGWSFTQARLAQYRPLIESVLLGDMDDMADYLDIDKVIKAARGTLSGTPAPDQETFTWQALCLTLWVRRQK